MASKNGTSNAAPGAILLAIHDFIARSTDELSLAKGDRIELIEKDDEFGDGWFLGKHLVNGNSGLFPEVYTTPAPRGTLTSAHKSRPSNASGRSLQNNAAVAALAASNKQQQQDPLNNTSPSAPTSSAAVTQPPTSQPTANVQPTLPSSAPRSSTASSTPSGALRNFAVASDSPVMSETLSVIDEHITDMKAPRNASYSNGHSKRDTISSVYSAQPPLGRTSYIAGHETDEEEQQAYTKEEVMAWTPTQVAEYLEDRGVEKSHCEVFIEQEITGEVLLAMDQNSLFIKEFELGSVGRRLKTWHKIKALHDEVYRPSSPEMDRSMIDYSLDHDDDERPAETGRNRSSTIGAPPLPRGLTTKRQSGDSTAWRSSSAQSHHVSQMSGSNLTKRESFGGTSFQSLASASRPENTTRPSAQSVRNLNHSRRHSSIDSNATADGAARTMHRKQPSVDQKWQPGQPANGRHGRATSTESQLLSGSPGLVSPASPGDLDRGYFSSNELDGRSRRSVLMKRNSSVISPIHSQDSGILDSNIQPARYTSMRSYEEPPVSPLVSASHMSNMSRKLASFRSATTPAARTRTSPQTPIAPVVTKLDPSKKQSLDAIAASPTRIDDNASEASSDKPTPSPSGYHLGFFSQAKAKVTGLRSISDAVTREEKTVSPTKISSPTRLGTGSSTPSTENRSLDMTKSDLASRESSGSAQNLMPPPPVTKRPRAKSKKFTSAYTRGLEKKTPEESMQNCDYSGWMKKKSGSLVATWKTRLFVLKGRRLSYYYKDDDTEEKGLIDISFHRVLPAQSETLTSVLATAMGASATASPTSPVTSTTKTVAQMDLEKSPPKDGDDGLFIFKLVPPKAGMAKGVHFTRPTVHYFAVNSKQEGRLWMAALMKATIDRDETNLVTTTYNQKTISLEKAQARRERPPALRDLDMPNGRAELGTGDEASEKGLGIANGDSIAGAEQESERPDDSSSIAPSASLAEPEVLDEREREAVALNG